MSKEKLSLYQVTIDYGKRKKKDVYVGYDILNDLFRRRYHYITVVAHNKKEAEKKAIDLLEYVHHPYAVVSIKKAETKDVKKKEKSKKRSKKHKNKKLSKSNKKDKGLLKWMKL